MTPTPEEFEQARRRELARLERRLGSMTGRAFHNPGDPGLLEADSADGRWADMDIVRRWVAGPDEREARAEGVDGPHAGGERVGG